MFIDLVHFQNLISFLCTIGTNGSDSFCLNDGYCFELELDTDRHCHCPRWSTGDRCKFQRIILDDCEIDHATLKGMYDFFVDTNKTVEECEDRSLIYIRNTQEKTFVLNETIFHFECNEYDYICEMRKKRRPILKGARNLYGDLLDIARAMK